MTKKKKRKSPNLDRFIWKKGDVIWLDPGETEDKKEKPKGASNA